MIATTQGLIDRGGGGMLAAQRLARDLTIRKWSGLNVDRVFHRKSSGTTVKRVIA